MLEIISAKPRPEEQKEINNTEKWIIALLLGLIFFIVSHKLAFAISNSILSKIGLHTTNQRGNATGFGWTVHLIIFIALVRVLMK
ncbi:MAG: hypothetical protein ACMG6E_00150 [Candidatus Roizmanbacteria bacterium]